MTWGGTTELSSLVCSQQRGAQRRAVRWAFAFGLVGSG